MFHIVLALLLVFAVGASASTDIGQQTEKTRKTHQLTKSVSTTQYTLPNGLTVFLTENPDAPNVRVSHFVKAGSLHERPGITGIAHLFEHALFRPISPGAPSFFEISTKLGGDFDGSTKFESTYYATTVAPDKLAALLKHESDRFKKLVVTKELLDVERKAVWSEYSTKFDANPTIDLWFQIYQQGYKGHPFGWMIIGDRGDLEKITAEDCNAFFQKYYRPNNVGLFVTGNFKAKEALKSIIANYGDWPRGEEAKLPLPFSAKTKEIIGEGKLPSEARFVLFGFRTPYFDESNAAVQMLANYLLFDANAGLLKKRLVDSSKIAAEVSEFNFDYDNGMLKAGIVALPNTKLAQIRSEILKVQDDLKNLSDATLEIYKRNLYVNLAEALQRNAQLADQMALTWGKYGNIGLTSAFASKPVQANKEQLMQFMNQYFKPDNFIFMTHKGQSK